MKNKFHFGYGKGQAKSQPVEGQKYRFAKSLRQKSLPEA